MPLQTGPGQTSYTLDPPVAYPGMPRRPNQAMKVRAYVCSEAIPFGRVVELASGKVRLPQTASAIGKIVGVALYTDMKEPDSGGGYASGSVVPVVQIGDVWVTYAGTAPSSTTVADWVTSFNVYSSSTTATDRGKVTATATATTSGSEIYALPAGFSCESSNTTESLALVCLNLPG